MKNFFEFLKNLPREKLGRNTILIIIGGLVVGVLGLVVLGKLSKPLIGKACKSFLASDDLNFDREERLASIEAAQVKLGTISKRIMTVGKLKADKSVMIRSEMAGRIKELNFQEGSKIEQGETIIHFEDADLQAEVHQAEAELEFKKVEFERHAKIRNVVSGKQYDEAKAGYDMAVAKLDVAKAKLEKATILAPFSGTMGLIDKSVGAYVQPQDELVMLVDSDPMKIDFKVPEKNLHDIGVGQNAEVKFEGFPDEIFRATVEAIDARIDPLSHSIAVRATIPNADGRLRPGLFANVSLIVGEKSDALLVPESSLGREGNMEFLWIVESGKTSRRGVLTGTREKNQVEIRGGLRPGEIVVTSGQIKLGEGTAVKITNMPGTDVELEGTPSEGEEVKEENTVVEKKEEVPTPEVAQETATPANEIK